ncbi:MAG: hypothetical protein ACOYOO_06805 [Saprospiraceae bacterium]|jgi:hypothetical protein
MNYLIAVHPDKDEYVCQLLESLQVLGVIESFSSYEAGDVRPLATGEAPIRTKEVQDYDIAEQYRNLVD